MDQRKKGGDLIKKKSRVISCQYHGIRWDPMRWGFCKYSIEIEIERIGIFLEIGCSY